MRLSLAIERPQEQGAADEEDPKRLRLGSGGTGVHSAQGTGLP